MEAQKNLSGPVETVSPIFQLFFIFLSTSIIAILLFQRLETFKTQDVAPEIQLITPKKYVEFGGFSNIVTVGLYIDEFEKFDMVGNNFIFAGVIWFQFVPGAVSISTIEEFSFERAKILYRSPPDIQVIGNSFLVRYNIRVEFTSSLNSKDFPIEGHTLSLILVHKFVSPEEILFQSQEHEFIIKSDVKHVGWQYVDRRVITGYKEDKIDPLDPKKKRAYPVSVFLIDYSRYGIRFVILILLPLLLIFYLVLFAFSVDTGRAIPLSTGGITATLAYRFVIERLSPTVGYFMISDYLFFLLLAACCVVFFMTLIDAYAIRFSLVQKRFALVGLHVVISFFSFYFFQV